MTVRLIGALLIISGCGGLGFYMAWSFRREEQMLDSLCRVLELASCELSCRMTPLPQLLRNAGSLSRGSLRRIFLELAQQLERAEVTDAGTGLQDISARENLPDSVRAILLQLSAGLGALDLTGQVRQVDSARNRCRDKLRELRRTRTSRIRSYETLGLCTGAALAILLL